MYLSKNSRCVLQKNPWFWSNSFGRNFKITFMKSRARWPEDDPSKPPLRLNIPKDQNLMSNYEFNSSTAAGTSGGMEKTKLSSKWFGPRQCQYGGDNQFCENNSDSKEQLLLDGRKNSQLSNIQNYPVSIESNESYGKERDDRCNRDGGLRLKKVRSYNGIKLNELSEEGKDIDAEENGILTIQIVLDDRTGGDGEVIDRLSVGEVSDTEIKALAEAVVKELRNKECLDSGFGNLSQKPEEEAYLVIINVTKKDPSEETSAAEDKTLDRTEKFFSDQIQVRDLDLTDVLDRSILKEKISRYSGAKRRKNPSNGWNSWSFYDPEVSRSHPAERKSYPSLSANKKMEKRRRQFEWNLLKLRISSNLKRNNKNIKVSDIRKPKMSYTQQLANPGFIRPVEYAPEREIRMKIVPENHFEKKIQLELPFEPAIHTFELKPLSKHVRLVDEIPKSLDYPHLRKAGCESKDGSDISRISSSKVRSYHNSCGKYSDLGGETPFSIPIFDGTSNGDIPNIIESEKCNKLNDSTCSYCKLSQNDIYLQERIGNILASEESKKISNKGKPMERYEPDISDVVTPNEKVGKGDKIRTAEEIFYRIRGFGESGTENFQLNEECLDGSATDSGVNSKSISNNDESIMNIGNDKRTIPKIGDNIANLANEGLTEDNKGASDVDSLSMMKKVREIVDFDLKNAEKLFVSENSGEIDEASFRSVVLHDEAANQFKVDTESLEAAAKKNQRIIQDRISKNLPRDFLVYVKVPSSDDKKFPPKSGESILVYDERVKVSNVDFGLLKGLEKFEREENKAPATRAEPKIEDEEKVTQMNQIRIGDPEEVRKNNSDLFDDIFEMKIDKNSEGENSLPEHYVSDNILKMSKNSSHVKVRPSKVETVKLNVTANKRPPSKVTEINLNQKSDDGKGLVKKNTVSPEKPEMEKSMFKDIEKYGTSFGDPEYEEKNVKINTDLESNPNLKRLDSCCKTLVLQEIGKVPENVDSWIKDETDKMATLLLKVLHDATDGTNKRRIVSKTSVKANPYEAIRKKQESGLVKSKRKDTVQNKALAALTNFESKNVCEEKQSSKMGKFPVINVEGLDRFSADFFLPNSSHKTNAVVDMSENGDEIPGPVFLKKVSSLWKFMPDIGCQATIFFMLRMFYVAKFFTSFVTLESNNLRNDPFRGLFKKYGPIVKLRGPLTGDVVLLNRPEDISKVFYQTQVTPSRSVFDSLENCRNRIRTINFLNSGITGSCSGIDWDVVRKSAVDVSHKGCLHYFDMLKSTNAMLLNKIDTMRNKQKQVPDDFMYELKKWSMEGLCGLLLDKSLGFLEKKSSQMRWICESERLLKHLQEATDLLCQCESKFQLWRFINTPSMSSLNQSYQSLDLILSKYVYQAEISLRRRKKALRNSKQDRNRSLNFLESALIYDQMTSEEITSNLIDILLVGVNTSSAGLGFLLYNLAQNNRVQNQLFEEVKGALPNKDSDISYHQLISLKYLQACLKESMRVNVPIPFLVKVLPNDLEFSHYHLPCGTHVILDYQMASTKEQNFDEPERFKPERWLNQDNIHPFSSVPFCNGPRSSFVKCLAEIQLWACIAKIVRKYQINYHFGEIKPSGRIISHPHKSLKLTFIERNE